MNDDRFSAGRPKKKHRVRNTLIGAGVTVALALGGTAWWAIDRFLIEKVEVTNASTLENTTSTDTVDVSSSATITENTYTSDNTAITITQKTMGSGNNTVTYYVADIQLSTASTLRSAFADDSFGQNITDYVSSIAEDNDAVFAINGDYYGFRNTGIIIRNGVIYRDEGVRTGLAIFSDGTMKIYDETTTDAHTLLDNGVVNTLSFGPALVEDGSVVDGIDNVEIDTNFGNHSIQGTQPRTAIGMVSDNHFIFVVVDGRDKGYSRGATMTELAEIMQDEGCTVAYNLDGGGSSEMWFNGSVVNQPSNGGERATSDILYIASGS